MKKYFKGMALSLVISGVAIFNSACSCNSNKVKITFVTEGNSDIVKYVKKGQSLVDIPDTPAVKGKYCVWDREDFQNIESDITVTAQCFSTVTELRTNLPSEINVNVATPEAELSHILKDLEMDVTFESGEKKIIYDDYILEENGYNKDIGGSYVISLKYNNAKKDITINVLKATDYLTVSLETSNGYYEEGLPKLVANTDVEGDISFDSGQVIKIGNHVYDWTFIPKDKERYEIVHGKISVSIITTSQLTINKEEITVDFATSKEDIIAKIKEGLVVQAVNGYSVREIDPQYYTIDSDTYVLNTSGTFDFNVNYMNLHKAVKVHVKQYDTYSLIVDDVEEFIIESRNNPKLSYFESVIQRSASVLEGSFTFVKGNEEVKIGNYEYEYIFTPYNQDYAPRKGKVTINTYKAVRMDLSYEKAFIYDYSSDIDVIKQDILDNVSGIVVYTGDMTKNIDDLNIKISYSEGKYYVDYNDGQLQEEVDVIINKIVLEENVDFEVDDESFAVDTHNPSLVANCSVKKLSGVSKDFQIEDFDVVQVGYDESTGTYSFELTPKDSVSYKFETIRFTYNPNN